MDRVNGKYVNCHAMGQSQEEANQVLSQREHRISQVHLAGHTAASGMLPIALLGGLGLEKDRNAQQSSSTCHDLFS